MRTIFIAFLLVQAARGQDSAKALEHAREVNLERAAKLPNFVADETAKRYKSRHTNPPQWEFVDTIEAEISVKGAFFRRDNTRLNGSLGTSRRFPILAGARSSVRS